MEILKLNEISPVAEKAFGKNYKLTKDAAKPDGIILRSFNMNDYAIPDSVLCVGRAGAGVNNIPVNDCAAKGIVVFNTPGANANAVKELVLCALLLSARKIVDGINWTDTLKGTPEIGKQVESGKKAFGGGELRGKKLGVVGLGAIGVLVANAAHDLGMSVAGYDPYISVDAAWNLDHNVKKEADLNKLLSESDYITLHVPLTNDTRAMINAETIKTMKKGVSIVNFSRGELVNADDVVAAVKDGTVSRYVTDFPSEPLIGVKDIICIPHLGASTEEAEDNCALMAASQMMDFLENGNIVNSVNFAPCKMARNGSQRITVIHKNVKNVIQTITNLISQQGINICNFNSQAKGDFAYAIIDTDEVVGADVIKLIDANENIVRVRVL